MFDPGSKTFARHESTIRCADHPRPNLLLALSLALLTICAIPARAQDDTAPPAPPTNLVVNDHPWDKGEKVDLAWALSTDNPATVTAYRVFRSLTRKPRSQVEMEDRLQDLKDLFENLYLPMFGIPESWPAEAVFNYADPTPEETAEASAQLRSAIQDILPAIRTLAESQHARDYEYYNYVRTTSAALDAYLLAGMGSHDENRLAARAVAKLIHVIPLSEVQKQDDDHELNAERAARMDVTEQKLKTLFGDRWKENWEDRADEIPSDLRRRLFDDRLAAESKAEARALAEIEAWGDETRWKLLIDLTPDLLNIRRGRMHYTVEKLDRHQTYLFKIVAVNAQGIESEPVLAASRVRPSRQFYDGSRLALMVIMGLVCGAVIFFIGVARSGKPLKVRKIAGLSAVEEAVGRATEMGRPILFVCGIQDMNDIQTIAGLTVLSRVARTAAEYDAKIEVPTARSLVMTAARETVQSSYLAAGRPDSYNEDLIYYVTDEQFGFVAYLQGTMAREKPAACFYMGTFFAESLILAETGNSIGAIQIAGTAMPAQLPFFVAACDYTLIGEEFFAASAYLSGEPDQLGSLKGQDVGKGIVAIIVLLGVLLATAFSVAAITGNEVAAAYLQEIVEYIKKVILT